MQFRLSALRRPIRARTVLIQACFQCAALLAAGGATAQDATVQRAVALLEAGRPAEAKTLLGALTRQRPEDAHVAYLYGRAHLDLAEIDEGVRLLERAVQLDGRQPVYHLVLGQAYAAQLGSANALRQRGIAERLRRSFERALELDPANVPARVHLVEYYLRAPRVVGGDLQIAREYADAIVAYDGYVGAFMQLSVHDAARDSVAMERVLRRLITTYPDSATPRLGLATMLQDRGRAAESWPLLQPLTEQERPHPGAVYLTGRLSAVSGTELARGEQALRRYLQHTPQAGEPPHAAAHTRLGDILHHRGDTAGARREYEAALRLDPEFQQAREALRRLR